MRALFSLPLVLMLACSGAHDSGPVGPAARDESTCAEGVEAYPRWQGEYPGPVVHVKAAVEVAAFDHPCDTEPRSACTLLPGIFHPWGEGDGFVTVRSVQRFRATDAFSLEGIEVSAGEAVEIVGYVAEGFCTWRVRGEEIVAPCPDAEDMPVKELSSVEVPERQLFRAGCPHWVLVDDALFALPEIAKGTIVKWGEVGPER
jgi:hypothetical protein